MARSKCGSCGSSTFELVEQDRIRNSNFKLTFVQCSSCGVPIGVMDYYNIGDRLNDLEKRLKNIESTIGNVDHNVVAVAELVKKKK
ncbi:MULTISPECIES: hypothetical protein [unclassified Acinetobacter]|uniref:hypothetical protein n=1 Tax=unclassified Acinetobacter TaxID=196816 RepID=UPI00244801E9|nr:MULTISPECIES: hypothetical protein [unclassified Acinetobacter]MDH0032043.1 hypothetical protein [Acinetobacter sp. GD04021]MDH0887699.1 hypothetical protein [Acinetobacter sp. GD03873]MDH1084047.1 hypothetical protein [Acinetobacter sp. GD03983]MDH2191026.1 hypothetical protein [Acinetobacter sp. GD03645]MDH2204559.1 hypothetical protein [Acinetobacter sp. GD03647]